MFAVQLFFILTSFHLKILTHKICETIFWDIFQLPIAFFCLAEIQYFLLLAFFRSVLDSAEKMFSHSDKTVFCFSTEQKFLYNKYYDCIHLSFPFFQFSLLLYDCVRFVHVFFFQFEIIP